MSKTIMIPFRVSDDFVPIEQELVSVKSEKTVSGNGTSIYAVSHYRVIPSEHPFGSASFREMARKNIALELRNFMDAK